MNLETFDGTEMFGERTLDIQRSQKTIGEFINSLFLLRAQKYAGVYEWIQAHPDAKDLLLDSINRPPNTINFAVIAKTTDSVVLPCPKFLEWIGDVYLGEGEEHEPARELLVRLGQSTEERLVLVGLQHLSRHSQFISQAMLYMYER